MFFKHLLKSYIPVLVEATTAVFGHVFSPYGQKSAKAMWCLDVTDNTNTDHRRSLNDGHSFDDLLLVDLLGIKINK